MTQRLLFVATIIALLTSCISEEFERVITKFTWDAQQELFRYNVRFVNIGPGLFDCDNVDGCLAEIKRKIPGGDYFELAETGATSVQQHLERREQTVDLIIEATAPVDSPMASNFGVVVAKDGKPGKERPHLLIVSGELGEPVDLPRGARHRLHTLNDDGKFEVYDHYALPPRSREITLQLDSHEEYTPLLEAMPELAERLQEAGLL